MGANDRANPPDGERRENFDRLRGEIRRHDLREGIPFQDASVDAVYHSHVLEHIDRGNVASFFAEVRRVLRVGGVHRIVVPDLEVQARQYLASLDKASDSDPPRPDLVEGHAEAVHVLIEQMVRREAYTTSTLRPLRRKVENVLLGDARKRGETHQWMWDRISLPHELTLAGFRDPQLMSNTESRIANWPTYELDQTPDGLEYKPGSLYVEAVV